jgi:hypothetical protein
MAYSFGEMMGKVKNFKLQKNVMRLISNARRVLPAGYCLRH